MVHREVRPAPGATLGTARPGSAMHADLLKGVYAALVTPFAADDEVSFEGLVTNLERLNRSALRGYWVNGEFRMLSVTERLRVLGAVLAQRAPGKVVIAGCSAECTREAIELARHAAGWGAELASLSVPSAYLRRVSAAVIERHVRAVADGSPIPLVLYNNPAQAAGLSYPPELLARLASHPNLAGLKDSAADGWRERIRSASPGFALAAGTPELTLDMLRAGGAGAILTTANVLPGACVRLYQAFREGRVLESEDLRRRLTAFHAQTSGAFGVAGVKAAMELAGLVGGAPRRPYLPLEPAQRAAVRRALEESGLAE
jgi:4-hydroxy-2-oxoglutarate aldolase